MKIYQTKVQKFAGTHYAEVYKKAFAFYWQIKKRTKRRSYIRSAYFNGNKIFLGLFWQHLQDKFSIKDKVRRLKYFSCAIELIERSHFDPISKENVDRKSEVLHRFMGMTPEQEIFFVQVKENKKNDQKYLISVFPME